MAEPDHQQLYNEDGHENVSLPSFASTATRSNQQLLPVEMRKAQSPSPIRKQYSLNYTTSGTCESTTDAYSTSSSTSDNNNDNNEGKLLEEEDPPRYDQELKHESRDNSQHEVEYSLADFFQCKMNSKKKSVEADQSEEPFIEELDDDSSDDEFAAKYCYDGDEEEDDSVLSLNTLVKDDDGIGGVIVENCKDATKMGCLGLIHFGLSGFHEKEEVLNSACYDDNNENYETRNDEPYYVPSEPSEPFYEILVIDEASFISNKGEEPYNSDEDASSCGPFEPEGEKLVANEISFSKASGTNPDLAEAEPTAFLDPFPYVHDDDDDDRDKLEELAIVLAIDEESSVSSDWTSKQGEDEDGDSSDATTSIYLECSSQAPEDDSDSLVPTTSAELNSDEEDQQQEQDTTSILVVRTPAAKLEPDGIKMQSHKGEKHEIQGAGLDGNGLKNDEELEVLHLEEPPYDILEV